MATPDVLQTTSSVPKNFTVCSLCQDTFRRPKILPCLHTFCHECLQEHFEKVNGLSNDNQTYSCPSCDMEIVLPAVSSEEQFVDNLKDDQFMLTLVELKRSLEEGKVCDICTRREEKLPAVNWCSDCNDALCESCSQVHRHVKVTAKHSVSSLEEMRKLPLETIMRKKNKVNCDKHGESVTLFCVDCNDPLCVQCLAVSHRRCENVITVADAASKCTDIDNIMETLRSLQVSIDSVDSTGNIETALEESIETARHEIMYLRNSLTKKIEDKTELLLKQLDGKAKEARKILKDRIEPRRLQMKTAKSASDRMSSLLKYGSDVEILMEFNQIRKQIDDYNERIETNSDKLKVKIEFQPDDTLLAFQENMKCLGELRVDTGADEGISCWGVTCTQDDDIVVTDCKNKRIQKFNKAGVLVDHIQLDDEPRDITTCGNGGDVAVPLIGQLIIFISTRKTLTLIRKTKTERQYDGISYSVAESYLVVSCLRERCVDIIQLDGQVLQSIQKDNTGEYMFQEPRYLAASLDGTIIVSDIGSHILKCIDSRGRCIYTYNGRNDLKTPQGVCVDKIGNIFVADNSNDRIQLLTSNGIFQRYILVKDSGLERPCALMISGSNRLIIVQNDGMVKVYTYC